VQAERVIAVDVGGTKTLAGVVGRDGVVEQTVAVDTPDSSTEAILAVVAQVVLELLDADPVAVGLCVPCNLDRDGGTIFRATNLPLGGFDLARWGEATFRLPVAVENDGNAAARAEWALGCGRGARTVMVFTLGTGIGGGLVVDGRPFRGWAEFGHIVVDHDGVPCQGNCHGRGHLEALASGSAASRVAERLYGENADAHVLVEHAHGGDERAIEALERIGEYVGSAIGSLVNVFDPDVVAVGGGFGVAAGDLVLEPARRVARREAIQPADGRLRVVAAELGESASLIGAALSGFDAAGTGA
jgi:glucokinase